jgi:hypothetical protein
VLDQLVPKNHGKMVILHGKMLTLPSEIVNLSMKHGDLSMKNGEMVVWGKAMNEKLGWVNISGAPRKNMALVELMCI